MEKINIPCVILAGGKSSRLGQDKTQIDFAEQSLSQWVFERLKKMFEKVYISTKEKAKFDFDAPFLVEKSPIYTPLAGMINAFESLDAQEIIFISVDCPFITHQTLIKIANTESEIVYAQSPNQAHYLISKWQKYMLDALIWAFKSKNYSLHNIAESHQFKTIPASERECFNINTMKNYYEALKLYEEFYNPDSVNTQDLIHKTLQPEF